MMLDYLVTTSLLLVTEVQEWLDRPQNSSGRCRIPGSSAYSVQRWLAIIHGDPLPPSPPTSPAETAASVPWTISDRRISGATSSSGPRSANTSEFYGSVPSTPATSVHSSFFSPGQEDVPPVPPLPDLTRWSQYEIPQASELYRNPYAQASSQSLLPSSPPPPIAPISRQQQQQQQSQQPSQQILRPSRLGRQLPTPPMYPAPAPPPPSQLPRRPNTAQPWQSSDGFRSTDQLSTYTSSNGSTIRSEIQRSPSPSMQSTTSSGSGSSRHSLYRNSARSSLGRNVVPPPMPPPADMLPLPPKLAQEYQYQAAVGASSSGRRSSLSQVGPSSSSGLQPSNPDPVDDEEQLQARRMTEAALTGRQRQAPPPPSTQPSPQPQSQSPPPPPPPVPQHLQPPVEGFGRMQIAAAAGAPLPPMADGGPVRTRDAIARQSYAETIYEMPPPAYDAIDFSTPHVALPQRH